MSSLSNPPPYVTTLDLRLADQLLEDLKERQFDITTPPHTRFSAKKRGLACTLYESGKFVIQGKDTSEFIEFYLEPNILNTFNYTSPLSNTDLNPHIGIDESGKGDFFGPLCIAGVYLKRDQFAVLQKLGVKDSKTLSDSTIQKLAKQIKTQCLYHIVRINPLKYNQIYADFKNLNRLLAWGHATAIEQLVEQSGCKQVIIDQFADEWVVEQALKRKNITVDLSQRHRAEEDLAVAAASILARDAFLEGIKRLSDELGILLPKGASQAVKTAGLAVLRKWGKEKLTEICKKHFKTLDAILEKNENKPF
ncbi:MAG: ribonuclease HIII [Parachlamydiaceae bacterium]